MNMSTYKRGGKWWIRFRFNHKRYFKCSPDNSQIGAKAYEALLRQKLARGEPIIEPKSEISEAPSFREFSTQWFETDVKNNNKYSEMLNKESILRTHLNPFFGNYRLDRITSLAVETFKSKKLKEGLANKTINNLLIVLSKCLKTAQEWRVIESIPRVKLLKVQTQKFDYLSEEECRLLLNNCNGLLRDMIIVALKTGLRFGELIALEWSDIDFKNNLITVRQSITRGRLGSTKSNKIRYVPMLDEVQQLLLSRLDKNAYVFAKEPNKPLGPMYCLWHLHRACRASGLRKIGWHTLRHTFASHLAQKGISITLVKELLGHSDIRTTMRYSHLSPLATREAIKALEIKSGDIVETISKEGGKKIVNLIPFKSKIPAKAQ